MENEFLKDIAQVAGGTVISKEIINKSSSLLKSLFGPSLGEYGGLLHDNVRLRRFKNQIKIFSKAEKEMKKLGIDPKSINLKVLAPLIEYSSLEEDKSLQEKWSSLTVNILKGDSEVLLQQNSISVLNKLSSEDAYILDVLHEKIQSKRIERFKKSGSRVRVTSPSEYLITYFSFGVSKLKKEDFPQIKDFDLCIANLISLGLLKWEIDADVSASKAWDDPDDTDIDVDINIYNTELIAMTRFGEKFVEICRDESK